MGILNKDTFHPQCYMIPNFIRDRGWGHFGEIGVFALRARKNLCFSGCYSPKKDAGGQLLFFGGVAYRNHAYLLPTSCSKYA
jgi:hypothetical protein